MGTAKVRRAGRVIPRHEASVIVSAHTAPTPGHLVIPSAYTNWCYSIDTVQIATIGISQIEYKDPPTAVATEGEGRIPTNDDLEVGICSQMPWWPQDGGEVRLWVKLHGCDGLEIVI